MTDRTKSFLKVWVIRFLKFNLIGSTVFILATLMYWLTFPQFGFWAWIMANCFGGVLQFALTVYFNKKKHGLMFDPKEGT